MYPNATNVNLNINDFEYLTASTLGPNQKPRLVGSSKLTGGKFPQYVTVASYKTGEIVTFKPVDEDHWAFDPDQWDGEQMIYHPVHSFLGNSLIEIRKKVSILVLHHF